MLGTKNVNSFSSAVFPGKISSNFKKIVSYFAPSAFLEWKICIWYRSTVKNEIIDDKLSQAQRVLVPAWMYRASANPSTRLRFRGNRCSTFNLFFDYRFGFIPEAVDLDHLIYDRRKSLINSHKPRISTTCFEFILYLVFLSNKRLALFLYSWITLFDLTSFFVVDI